MPTWNYIAIHLRGELRLLEQSELFGILERLSENMEGKLSPKTPWKMDKLSRDAYEKMQRQIVPIQMKVNDIQGTWKLSQNKATDARHGAINGLNESGFGSEVELIVEQMKQVQE